MPPAQIVNLPVEIPGPLFEKAKVVFQLKHPTLQGIDSASKEGFSDGVEGPGFTRSGPRTRRFLERFRKISGQFVAGLFRRKIGRPRLRLLAHDARADKT